MSALNFVANAYSRTYLAQATTTTRPPYMVRRRSGTSQRDHETKEGLVTEDKVKKPEGFRVGRI